jgi:GNAT superfamily N-acetyltransferase
MTTICTDDPDVVRSKAADLLDDKGAAHQLLTALNAPDYDELSNVDSQLWVLVESTRARALALGTQRGAYLVSEDLEATAHVATALARYLPTIPTLTAPALHAEQFLAKWPTPSTQPPSHIDTYRAVRPWHQTTPDNRPPGFQRIAAPREHKLVSEWMTSLPPITAFHPDRVEALIRARTVAVWEQSGQVVSLVTWRPVDDDTLWIDNLYTIPTHRNQGITTALVDALVAKLTIEADVLLDIDADDANAIQIATTLNFTHTATAVRYQLN